MPRAPRRSQLVPAQHRHALRAPGPPGLFLPPRRPRRVQTNAFCRPDRLGENQFDVDPPPSEGDKGGGNPAGCRSAPPRGRTRLRAAGPTCSTAVIRAQATYPRTTTPSARRRDLRVARHKVRRRTQARSLDVPFRCAPGPPARGSRTKKPALRVGAETEYSRLVWAVTPRLGSGGPGRIGSSHVAGSEPAL